MRREEALAQQKANIELFKSGVTTKKMVETSVEDFRSAKKSETIIEIVVPYRKMGIDDIIRHVSRIGSLRPAVHTALVYRGTLYRSDVKETAGLVIKGASCHVYGYEVEINTAGHIVTEELDNPVLQYSEEELAAYREEHPEEDIPEKIMVPKLLTTRTEGTETVEIEPWDLMEFRFTWGRDFNRRSFNRVRTQPQLSINGGNGVPRYTGTRVLGQQGQQARRDALPPQATRGQGMEIGSRGISWNDIRTGFQSDLTMPFLVGLSEDPETWTPFYEWIPDSNIVEQNQENQNTDRTEIESPASSVTSTMPEDAFASGEDEE